MPTSRTSALTLVVCVVALLAPSTVHADVLRTLRDCALDGDLDRTYTKRELKQALDNLPGEQVTVQTGRAGAPVGASSRTPQWEAVRFRARGGWSKPRVRKLHGRRLQPGSYLARVSARAPGQESRPTQLRFRIR